MKNGKDIVELAQELQHRAANKVDMIANTNHLHMAPQHADTKGGVVPQKLIVETDNSELAYDVTPHTHRQLGTWAGIPAKYYDKMAETAPDLLAGNMNHWLKREQANKLLRTLDGNARAFLSDRYRRIDNEDIAEQVLPILLDKGNFSEIISTEVTERKMYIKALFPRVRNDVGVGDEVQAGVAISNSEIGLGSLVVEPLVYRLVCSNGMVSQDNRLSRYHVGRKTEGDANGAVQLFRDETIAADDKALMMKIRDIVNACADPAVFNAIVEKMRASKEGKTVENPIEAVKVLGKSFTLNEQEQGSVLENLIRGQDYSRFGVLNAVTATANTHDSYDRASELEVMGGKILDLPSRDWKVIAEAA